MHAYNIYACMSTVVCAYTYFNYSRNDFFKLHTFKRVDNDRWTTPPCHGQVLRMRPLPASECYLAFTLPDTRQQRFLLFPLTLFASTPLPFLSLALICSCLLSVFSAIPPLCPLCCVPTICGVSYLHFCASLFLCYLLFTMHVIARAYTVPPLIQM